MAVVLAPAEAWVSLAIVAACVALVVNEMGGALLVTDTTPAGGDMGAHVWGPAFLRDELLPRGRLTGWTPDWYAGFPAYHFYMLTPSLAIALLSYVVPYGIAFKVVAVSGVVTLPVAAAFLARMARMPFPGPALCAVGATAFLFDRSFSIYGGNIASTLAGEFAFSMALSLSLVYLGVLAHALTTGRHRALLPVLLASVGLTHLIPAFFALAASAVMVAVHPGSSPRWRRVAVVGLGTAAVGGTALAAGVWFGGAAIGEQRALWAVIALGAAAWAVFAPGLDRWRFVAVSLPLAGLLSAFWVLPFAGRSRYMNDMGWEKKEGCFFSTFLVNRGTKDPNCDLDSGLVDSLPLAWILALAAVGLLLSVLHRRRLGLFLAGSAAVAALAFWLAPDGRLWNARLTPFYYLCLYLLGAIGVAEVGRLLAALVAPDVRRPLRAVRAGVAVGGALVVLVALGLPLRALPGGTVGADTLTYRWGPLSTKDDSFVDAWATWNFKGYEKKPAWPEYRATVATMAQIGRDRGCGRAMWEHEEQHDRYGTPMALMLLPFWTSGCIGSMEGLYFEASTTTPYHFLNQDQLSEGPSNAQRDLPYGAGPPTESDFSLGVDHLQMLGVRYYMAISADMQAFADVHADLELITTTGPWKVYEVAGAPLVEGLANEPAVVVGADVGGATWQELAVPWYQDRSAWEVALADEGPEGWQRLDLEQIETGARPEARALEPVVVDDIASDEDSIRFRVDRTGVPVVVKTSYFPNWKVTGGQGPYRLTPNLMVVIPTDEVVRLDYGWTSLDLGAWALTLGGLVAVAVLWRQGRASLPSASPFWSAGDRDRHDDREARLGVGDDAAGSQPDVVGDTEVGGPPGIDA